MDNSSLPPPQPDDEASPPASAPRDRGVQPEQPPPGDIPTAETPAGEALAEEPPVSAASTEEPPVGEVPVEETPAAEVPVEEPLPEGWPTEEPAPAVAASTAPEPQPAAVRAPRPAVSAGRPWWFSPFILIASVLFALGGGYSGWYLGTHYLWKPSSSTEQAHETEKSASDKDQKDKERPAERAKGRPESPRLDDLRSIDDQILEGRYAASLEGLQRLTPAGEVIQRDLRYRIALCLEGLGRPVEAIPHYRACITGVRSPYLVAAAQLGLARACLRAAQVDEGRTILCALLCRTAEPVLRAYPYQGDAGALLALSLAEQVLGSGKPSATGPDVLALTSAAVPVERYLNWLDPPLVPPKPYPAPKSNRLLNVSRRGTSPRDYLVDAIIPRAELSGLVDELAQLAGIQTRWLPGAQDAVVGRRIELACRAVPLEELLNWLTLPRGLVYELDNKTLAIRLAATVPPADVRKTQVQQALRGLRGALLASKEFPLIGDVYVALGNLEVQAGNTLDATVWYEKLAREQARSPALVSAFYNLGLVWMQQGESAAARQAFFRAIDQTPGNDLAALCQWWIARTHLDEKDLAGAVRPLTLARQPEAGSQTVPAAVLALACMQLMEGQPRQAWELLRDNRDEVRKPLFVTVAAFIDAYARFRMKDDEPRKRQGVSAELVGLLLSPRAEPWLGPSLPYLQGQAMRELGMNQQMVALYDQTTRSVKGSLADEMSLQTAEVLAKDGQLEAARSRLEALKKAATPRWADQSQFRLAELDLKERQPDACLKRCRELLGRQTVERSAILAVMAQAYLAKRDYPRAAECLAGGVPAEST